MLSKIKSLSLVLFAAAEIPFIQLFLSALLCNQTATVSHTRHDSPLLCDLFGFACFTHVASFCYTVADFSLISEKFFSFRVNAARLTHRMH